MTDKTLPESGLPIRQTIDFLPGTFKTPQNEKFLNAVVDPMIQPGQLKKTVGYVGRRYGKTFNGNSIYLDDDQTLRSRYQLEPAVVTRNQDKITSLYDYLDFKNQLKFFENTSDRDDLVISQESYTWSPPIDWDKFVNYREYYWVPGGPPPVRVLGQAQEVTRTFSVRVNIDKTWVFTPDGLTGNPTITLYRGQTYRIKVNAPEHGFVIRRNYDSSSLMYNPDFPIKKNQRVIFNGKLWKALRDIPVGDGSTITNDSSDWEELEDTIEGTANDYNVGIKNNGTQYGEIEFTVSSTTPDVLYYQSFTDPNCMGKFIITDVESNTKIDVEKEIIGNAQYTSSNGVKFTNGLIVYFDGQVTPAHYQNEKWVVEGVGEAITLVKFSSLMPPNISKDLPEVTFDNSGFDTEPYDDALVYPSQKDYITINRSSVDSNAWSRYNRWFHKDVLIAAYKHTGGVFDSNESQRAKRPIIEFAAGLKLFNHCAVAKQPIDFIDQVTTDVFSTISGSEGYSIDGDQLFDGARVLFTADYDTSVRNKIYQVKIIRHAGSSSTGIDWTPARDYTAGVVVRFNGQPFVAQQQLPAIKVKVLSSSNDGWLRVPKNIYLEKDLLCVFEGDSNGVVEPLINYSIVEVDNTSSTTETFFKISLTRNGAPVRVNTNVFLDLTMSANYSPHTTKWKVQSSQRQIALVETDDSIPEEHSGVLVRRGNSRGFMYHFNGEKWVKSQTKESLNVSPLFDVFDQTGVSYSDQQKYPFSDFTGCKVVSYATGNSVLDSELGFSLNYLNITNVGDLLFNFDWDTDQTSYVVNGKTAQIAVNEGMLFNTHKNQFENCWQPVNQTFMHPIIDSKVVESETTTVSFNTIKWTDENEERLIKVDVYVDGELVDKNKVERTRGSFEFLKALPEKTAVSIFVYGDVEPDQGYYEFPAALEKNPLNAAISTFTLGQATDHLKTSVRHLETFNGVLPGNSNLRDISGYTQYANRFLKHSSVAPLAVKVLCDKKFNLIKAIEYASKSYRDFKNTFLHLASTLPYEDQGVVSFVDTILNTIASVKSDTSPFADSDMIGSGAFRATRYTVDDTGITVFSLSEPFDLTTSSRRAVYVYLNGRQLVVEQDYSFNSAFGFVEISKPLTRGDIIEFREYLSTAFCFIPPTPTKLGIYKKFTPEAFVDTTYFDPTLVIRGHDGSITVAFNDYRDDVLLELERRIYNNIKQQYQPDLFDVDRVFSSVYNTGKFSKKQQDALVANHFRKWLVDTNAGFIENSYFDEENSFSYTYSRMYNQSNNYQLPGWWRGIYLWYYDTVYPHLFPWEMLGFSQQPDWWETVYGPAPYTSNNLILWDDIRDGIIRYGDRAGIHSRYARPTIYQHMPVDGNGRLLSPFESGIVGDYSLSTASMPFKFGDVSPIEYSWRSSSDWPFVMMIACALAVPFEFIGKTFDKNSTTVNSLGQIVSSLTNTFLTLDDIVLPEVGGHQSSGLINYIVDYVKYSAYSIDEFKSSIANIDVNLSTRMSGFVDHYHQKYVLDSKTPNSKSSSVFVPQENYQIQFNVGTPIRTLTYSAVVVEKVPEGYKVYGLDSVNPYFSYYNVYASQNDPVISIGGVSETFVEWQPGVTYANGTIVRVRDTFYRATSTQVASTVFDIKGWKRLPKLPVVGDVHVFKRLNINRPTVRVLEYGTVFNTLQDFADFVFGYEAYLEDQGFEFTEYDNELSQPRNWATSIKEFLFWSRHNWAIGSLLALSPCSNKLTINTPVGVVENLIDGFYDYQILTSAGTVIPVDQINVARNYQGTVVQVTNPANGIYFFKGYVVIKEHITVFNDRTVFNDVIYDKPTGYRQERIKSRGFRTMDWDGDYTTPGFVFDSAEIKDWQPFIEYKLGDCVTYKSYKWTSLKNQPMSEVFITENWSRLDFDPVPSLVPNFDFRIKQIEDFFSVDSDGSGSSQRDLARHAVGYQPREYLQSLSEDEVSQFNIYQGFIKEKGTRNAVEKVFNKTDNANNTGIELNEEWAIKVGNLGGVDQTYRVEFNVDTSKTLINPQPLVITNSDNILSEKLYLSVKKDDFNVATTPYTTDIFKKSKFTNLTRSAGYVHTGDVDISIKTLSDLSSIDINTVPDNTNVWVTFDQDSWNVYRIETNKFLLFTDVTVDKDTNEIEIFLNRPHTYQPGDIVGIRRFINIDGFHEIVSVTRNSISIIINRDLDLGTPDFSTIDFRLVDCVPCRYSSVDQMTDEFAADLPLGAKLWIDNENNHWKVIQKQQRFVPTTIPSTAILNPRTVGDSVKLVESLDQLIYSAPEANRVVVAINASSQPQIIQALEPMGGFETVTNKSFGKSLDVSDDGVWMAIGAPAASYIKSRYVGRYQENKSYARLDIVQFDGSLFQAVSSVSAGINPYYTNYWKEVYSVTGNPVAYPGVSKQGAVFVYKWQETYWEPVEVLLSLDISADELFGSSVKLVTLENGKYRLFVGATGAYNNCGKVYVYDLNGNRFEQVRPSNYRGIHDQTELYNTGDLVRYSGLKWQAIENTAGIFDPSKWEPVHNNAFGFNLPVPSAYFNYEELVADVQIGDSTLYNTGAVSHITENLAPGDRYGSSISSSLNGKVLVVSAPYSDNNDFEHFKGVWNAATWYTPGDVVKVIENNYPTYYKLTHSSKVKDVHPSNSLSWEEIKSDKDSNSGKVFVYQLASNGLYELVQTINGSDLDTDEYPVNAGDFVGYQTAMDTSGYTLVVSSPYSSIDYVSRGIVIVLTTNSLEQVQYKKVQVLESFEEYENEFFGSSLAITPRAERIVVGAKHTTFRAPTTFDGNTTSFDRRSTRLSEDLGYSGQAYVYEKTKNSYVLVEKLAADLQESEAFGHSVSATTLLIAVGSPKFKSTLPVTQLEEGVLYAINQIGTTDWYSVGLALHLTPAPGVRFTATFRGTGTGSVVTVEEYGKVRLFTPDPSINGSWNVIRQEEPLTDLNCITRVRAFDYTNSVNLGVIDVVDNYKMQLLGSIEDEIRFKTIYDPAVYTHGSNEHSVDESTAWFNENVGHVWWDLSTAKFLNFEQDDVTYRISNCNALAPFASIDVYEWVETELTPERWIALSGTPDGDAIGVSGTPYYGETAPYSKRIVYNTATGEEQGTLYYYWVKDKVSMPSLPFRKVSGLDIANSIKNPITANLPFITVIDSNVMLLWNFKMLATSNIALQFEFNNGDRVINPVHTEFHLMTEGTTAAIPTIVENKWIDSLVGYDTQGRKVPDTSLSAHQRYGLSVRPRQTMFSDRLSALSIVIDKINSILTTRAFSDTVETTILHSVDRAPAEILNEYDQTVNETIDLQNVGTSKLKSAVLRPEIVNGQVVSITIVDGGFGYKLTPPIVIDGDGVGATAFATLDSQGRIKSVTVTNTGRKYLTAVAKVRPFSVLVLQDETVNNFWAVYGWDQQQKTFVKRKVQAFDTTRYWYYQDWYAPGYSSTTRVIKEINSLFMINTVAAKIGDVIKVREYGSGGWALLVRAPTGQGNVRRRFTLIGRQNGTIQLNKSLLVNYTQGYDAVAVFDGNLYDYYPSTELRNILLAVKNHVLIEDLKPEWNNIFFACLRQAFIQHPALGWAFKTSFINVTHKVGSLGQPLFYRPVNDSNFEQYISEVKPYRTTIREFKTQYDWVENTRMPITDFDLPPVYISKYGQIVPPGPDFEGMHMYPWKFWKDNQGFAVTEINVHNSGSGYLTPPTVVIEGDSVVPATATAYISNGRVSGVKVTNPGKGYLTTPTVSLVGGNGASQDIATAYATIGNSVIRSINIGMKFDRISRNGITSSEKCVETFVSSGVSAVFTLKYAPSYDRTLITVFKNEQRLLKSEYKITFYVDSTGTYRVLRGKLILNTLPHVNDVVRVEYEKNVEYFDAVDRIEKYYSPTSGMKGKVKSQLMTGVDFGGVVVQGNTFNVTGGWDSLPWFTDNWDSVEPNSDFYYVVNDLDKTSVELPYTLEIGEKISVYLKRGNTTTRVDYLGDKPAETPYVTPLMPTFVNASVTKPVISLVNENGNPYLQLQEGDTLIFRKFDSTGASVISDSNIVDTNVKGGSLDSIDRVYSTANGLTADEISLSGGKFYSPETVPAPEELVPGHFMESVSIRVFHTKLEGSTPVQNTVIVADGNTVEFPIGLDVPEKSSVSVYVNKQPSNASVNLETGTVTLKTAPQAGSIVEVIAIGVGGVAVLEYLDIVADGRASMFTTKSLFKNVSSILVTVNGEEYRNVMLRNSRDVFGKQAKAVIQFDQILESGSVIKIFLFNQEFNRDSQGIVRVNKQIFNFEPSVTQYMLDQFVTSRTGSAASSMFVEVDGKELKGPDTVRVVYNGNNNLVHLGTDPHVLPNSILQSEVKVYINNVLQPPVVAYSFNTSAKVVTIDKTLLTIDDEIKVVTSNLSDYVVENGMFIIKDQLLSTLTPASKFEITWFSEYKACDIISDQYTGGQYKYYLKRAPLNSSYVWVFKNGSRLTKDHDYYVDKHNMSVSLTHPSVSSDTIKIVEFGSNTWSEPHGFEVFKDMLNQYHFTRFSYTDCELIKDLQYFDTQIVVNNGNNLFDPETNGNRPGIVIINGERIEYRKKVGNILTRLRRGCYGTSIPETHAVDSPVVDASITETIPYKEEQEKFDFVSDGSSLTIGPLPFVPVKSKSTWSSSTIPADYGQNDQVEVFVGGRRLSKVPRTVYDEQLGATSPAADVAVDAEFSVNGVDPYIRLTEAPPAGVRITVVRRTGSVWYDMSIVDGELSGKPLHSNQNYIARFITEKTTKLPN